MKVLGLQLQSSSGDHSTFAGLAGNVGPFAPPECTPGSVRVYGMQGGDGYDLGPKIYERANFCCTYRWLNISYIR